MTSNGVSGTPVARRRDLSGYLDIIHCVRLPILLHISCPPLDRFCNCNCKVKNTLTSKEKFCPALMRMGSNVDRSMRGAKFLGFAMIVGVASLGSPGPASLTARTLNS